MSLKSRLSFFILPAVFVTLFFADFSTFIPPSWFQRTSIEKMIDARLSLHWPKSYASRSNSANMARALYYYMAGPPTTGYPAGFSGPENGLLGFFSEVIEDPAVNRSFS